MKEKIIRALPILWGVVAAGVVLSVVLINNRNIQTVIILIVLLVAMIGCIYVMISCHKIIRQIRKSIDRQTNDPGMKHIR